MPTVSVVGSVRASTRDAQHPARRGDGWVGGGLMQEAANGRQLAHFPFYNPRLSGAAHGGGGGDFRCQPARRRRFPNMYMS